VDGAEIGIISYGSNDAAIQEARDMLAGAGVKTSYLRLRALPTTKAVDEFAAKHDRVYVIENNFDGQMLRILQSEMPKRAAHMHSISLCDGLPLTAKWIAQTLVTLEQER
jgi:2-oxoglutarate ferredoxin oxidoreductase subunit alpha